MHGGAEEGFSKRRVERGEARGGYSSPEGHLQLAKASRRKQGSVRRPCIAASGRGSNFDGESRVRKVDYLYIIVVFLILQRLSF